MLSLNWIDYLIVIVLAIYAYNGYASGFVRSFLDLANFVLSFLIGLRFYGFLSGIMLQIIPMPQGFADAIGFFMTAFIAQIIIGILIREFNKESTSLGEFNKWFGILPGILSGVILVSFMLVLIVALPITSVVRQAISSSQIGGLMLFGSQGLEGSINKVFGRAISETINFLTVEPKGSEIVSLHFNTKISIPDSDAEKYMFKLVNKERVLKGLKEVVFDNGLRDVGRIHCKDMFARGYFSHYTPEGYSPFNRMDEAGILYGFAGENLALSPNADIAMRGLMNSPGHKENILSENFGRVGIGVMDGGIYGEMFCQEFTD